MPGGRPRADALQHSRSVWNEDGTVTVKVTKLRLVLDEQDLPDYQIAALAGFAPITMSNYSRGQKQMSTKHLTSLCRVLGVEPTRILGWTERRFNSDGVMIEQTDMPLTSPYPQQKQA